MVWLHEHQPPGHEQSKGTLPSFQYCRDTAARRSKHTCRASINTFRAHSRSGETRRLAQVLVHPRAPPNAPPPRRGRRDAGTEQRVGTRECIDSQTGMLPGMPGSARCVQRFDDSRNSAIHITYRISLRSSSLREPRDPLSKVVFSLAHSQPEPLVFSWIRRGWLV